MSDRGKQIENPESTGLDVLCDLLRNKSGELIDAGCWPRDQLLACARAGVFRWFVSAEFGGLGWSPQQIVRGYEKLGASCLTTTFVITQWVAAVQRMAASNNREAVRDLLPELLSGKRHITVGISHLTTSRRHIEKPAMVATKTESGFVLDGFCPWVTAAPFTDYILAGAVDESQRQVLICVPTDLPGITVAPSCELVALSGSRTGPVEFDSVNVPRRFLISGPSENVFSHNSGLGAGGLQTSALALSLAKAAVDFVIAQAERRPELTDKAESLGNQWTAVHKDLVAMVQGDDSCGPQEIRTAANSLVLRSTQAALVAAKGAGFVHGHPVGRWCQEALFFLVWSCPPAVAQANLCELAMIES